MRFIKDELGFIRCSIHIKTELQQNNEMGIETMTEKELEEKNAEMIQDGYIPNYSLDCYIVDGFGAWMGSTTNMSDFEKNYMDFIDNGYDLILRPNKSHLGNFTYQVFCRNYMKIFECDMDKKAHNKEYVR